MQLATPVAYTGSKYVALPALTPQPLIGHAEGVVVGSTCFGDRNPLTHLCRHFTHITGCLPKMHETPRSRHAHSLTRACTHFWNLLHRYSKQTTQNYHSMSMNHTLHSGQLSKPHLTSHWHMYIIIPRNSASILRF